MKSGQAIGKWEPVSVVRKQFEEGPLKTFDSKGATVRKSSQL